MKPPDRVAPGATPAVPGSSAPGPAPVADAASGPPPWQRITVDVPGADFEARSPGRYAFDYPDTECDGWSTADLTVRSASVRGARHRYYGQPRQDAVRVAAYEPARAIAFAVADGVSSATEAERGALEACCASLEMVLDQLSRGEERLDFRAVARHANERLLDLARWRLGVEQPDIAEVAALYATTLVAGTVRVGPGGPIADMCRIGDSGAWTLERPLGRYRPLFPSKTGADVELVAHEVTPLPHLPASLEHVRVRLPPSSVLLVGTDGFGDPLGDGDGRIGSLFARHLAAPSPPAWFAHVLDFSRETFDDDRSLMAVWPRTPPEGG